MVHHKQTEEAVGCIVVVCDQALCFLSLTSCSSLSYSNSLEGVACIYTFFPVARGAQMMMHHKHCQTKSVHANEKTTTTLAP